jgi:hypothetical protein
MCRGFMTMLSPRLAHACAWGSVALLTGLMAMRAHAAAGSQATELTGVLLQALDATGNPTDLVWHTSADPAAYPLGLVLDEAPTNVRFAPLQNDQDGEIDGHLLPGMHVGTLFWQMERPGIPPNLVLNLFFGGDNLTPGISAVVQYRYGFTNFQANTAPTTPSLYLRDVDNAGSLFYDDGHLRGTLVAAFYMSSAGVTNQWRPSDFVNVDRVGLHGFRPNTTPDGLLVFQLLVSPAAQPTPDRLKKAVPGSRGLVGPLQATVGADQWVPPARSTFAPPSARPQSQETPVADAGRTPGADETPTASDTSTPASAAADETPLPGLTGTPLPAGTRTPGTSALGSPVAAPPTATAVIEPTRSPSPGGTVTTTPGSVRRKLRRGG